MTRILLTLILFMSGLTLTGPGRSADYQTEADRPNPYHGSVLGQYSDEQRREILAMLHRDLGWDKEDAELDAEAAK